MTRITDNLREDEYTFLIISRSLNLRMRNYSDRSCRETKTHLSHSRKVFFSPPKMWCLWDNVKIYCRAEQATDDNMAHALCILDTEGYKHTLTVCNTNW